MLTKLVATGLPPITPTSGSGLPGQTLLTTIASDLMTFVLVLCLLGLLTSAGMIAIGHHSQNQRLADRGRSGAVAAVIGALVAGGAVAIINFAFTSGGNIH
ncbi:MAG: DUF6112 family protein [Acidimicrobiales bacterium]